MNKLLIPVHVIMWVLDFIIGIPMYLLGLVVIPIALSNHWVAARESKVYKGKIDIQWTPRWMFPWSNEEDGVFGSTKYITEAYKKGWHANTAAFVWSALRNPVNNLRYVKPFGVKIDRARVHYFGNAEFSPYDDAQLSLKRSVLWSYTWQGLYAGLWVRIPMDWKPSFKCDAWWKVWTYRVFREFGIFHINIRAGWKLVPKDSAGITPMDYRYYGCGSGLQLQWRRGK